MSNTTNTTRSGRVSNPPIRFTPSQGNRQQAAVANQQQQQQSSSSNASPSNASTTSSSNSNLISNNQMPVTPSRTTGLTVVAPVLTPATPLANNLRQALAAAAAPTRHFELKDDATWSRLKGVPYKKYSQFNYNILISQNKASAITLDDYQNGLPEFEFQKIAVPRERVSLGGKEFTVGIDEKAYNELNYVLQAHYAARLDPDPNYASKLTWKTNGDGFFCIQYSNTNPAISTAQKQLLAAYAVLSQLAFSMIDPNTQVAMMERYYYLIRILFYAGHILDGGEWLNFPAGRFEKLVDPNDIYGMIIQEIQTGVWNLKSSPSLFHQIVARLFNVTNPYLKGLTFYLGGQEIRKEDLLLKLSENSGAGLTSEQLNNVKSTLSSQITNYSDYIKGKLELPEKPQDYTAVNLTLAAQKDPQVQKLLAEIERDKQLLKNKTYSLGATMYESLDVPDPLTNLTSNVSAEAVKQTLDEFNSYAQFSNGYLDLPLEGNKRRYGDISTPESTDIFQLGDNTSLDRYMYNNYPRSRPQMQNTRDLINQAQVGNFLTRRASRRLPEVMKDVQKEADSMRFYNARPLSFSFKSPEFWSGEANKLDRSLLPDSAMAEKMLFS